MVASVFESLVNKMRGGDSWTRWLYSTLVVFGGLIIAQSFGARWALPVAGLILIGVLVTQEGKQD